MSQHNYVIQIRYEIIHRPNRMHSANKKCTKNMACHNSCMELICYENLDYNNANDQHKKKPTSPHEGKKSMQVRMYESFILISSQRPECPTIMTKKRICRGLHNLILCAFNIINVVTATTVDAIQI